MPGYAVDLERLDKLRLEVQALVDQCDALRSQIGHAAFSLTEAEWTGSAASEFALLQQTWNDGAAKIQSGLAVMAANVQASHANYSAVQQANARLWRTSS